MYTCFNEELIEYQQNCVKFVQELVNQKPCDNVISFGDFYRSLFEKSLIKEFKQEPQNYYTRLSILTQAVSSFDPALAYALICQHFSFYKVWIISIENSRICIFGNKFNDDLLAD